jgi:hypothetical protein
MFYRYFFNSALEQAYGGRIFYEYQGHLESDGGQIGLNVSAEKSQHIHVFFIRMQDKILIYRTHRYE